MKKITVELSNGSVLMANTLEELIPEINYLIDWNNEIKIVNITKWTSENTATGFNPQFTL